MALWWIGNIVALVVVVPVVVLILNEVLRPALEIKQYADDIANYGGEFGRHLDALQGLDRTRELAQGVSNELARYGRTLEAIR